jgi:hypothetical protein
MIELHKNIDLPVLLYRCETWYLILIEECIFEGVSEKVLRRIYGSRNNKGMKKISFIFCTLHPVLLG